MKTTFLMVFFAFNFVAFGQSPQTMPHTTYDDDYFTCGLPTGSGRVLESDDLYAEFIASGGVCQSETFETFGFTIPDGDVVDSILCNMEYYTVNGLPESFWVAVMWTDGNLYGYSEYGYFFFTSNETESTVTKKASIAEGMPTPAMVNANDFGISILFNNPSDYNTTFEMYVDYIELVVYYHTPETPTTSISKMCGVIQSQIKTTNGVAVANIKAINTVANQ